MSRALPRRRDSTIQAAAFRGPSVHLRTEGQTEWENSDLGYGRVDGEQIYKVV